MKPATALRKATANDVGLIGELLNLSNSTGEYGRGYPQGDLAGLEHEFEEIDKELIDNIYVIGEGVGVVGIFDSPWGCYLIGPVFRPEHHSAENVGAALKAIGTVAEWAGKKPALDAVEANQVIVAAATEAGLENTYRGVSMTYPITDNLLPVQREIVELEQSNQAGIKAVNHIFKAYLKPWQKEEHNAVELSEAIGDGDRVFAALQNGQVVGGLVWSWDEELEEGEIEYLCVAKEQQGNGFARDLMNSATNYATQNYLKGKSGTWYLDTEITNTQGIEFYKRYGFTEHYRRSVFRLEL